MHSFQGKIIVITGAAGGLGSAMVRAFSSAGGSVVIADVERGAAEILARSVGDTAVPMTLDVTHESDWEVTLDRVENELGGLDVLVNNAGYFQPNIPFEDMPFALWRRHFAVNADGTFLGCKHAIRRMKPRGHGAIVNIASGMALSPRASASAYCASKAAVLMTTRTAAAAAGPFGIRVNAVLPGAVPTAMLMGNLVPGQTEQSLVRDLAQRGALGRLATPDEIAQAVLFLADSDNGAITGIALPVDGGNLVG